MSEDGLKLTAYIGERDRSHGRLLADLLIDIYERHGVRTSALLRGIEGFGIKHRLASERLLSLSEDLPILALAVDTRPCIESVLAEVQEVSRHGVITLERVRMLDGPDIHEGAAGGPDGVKLTIYVGRQERAAGRPAHLAVVDCLHSHGLDGATVLLGLDGIVHGVRRRGRFLGANEQVPVVILSVGDRRSVDRALPELCSMLSRPSMTLERVRVCKRDGLAMADPQEPPPVDPAGLAYWQKLVVYASEQTRYGHQPLYSALIRRLRREGAAGATALRGQWGYHGEHRPHGERFWSIARHVPALTVVLDTPANMARWFAIADAMTTETGLVTSELVPALRAAGPEIQHGGLRLAEPHDLGCS
jgi:PII-like signaling protein